jgi:hypothetical protein
MVLTYFLNDFEMVPVAAIITSSLLLLLFIYSHLLLNRWRSSAKSRSLQQIKAIYPSSYRMMCAVLISVSFCSSAADV